MKVLTAIARRIGAHIYVIRCTDDDEPQLALSRRGYLAALKYAGRDASVHTVAGRWIAGRRVGV